MEEFKIGQKVEVWDDEDFTYSKIFIANIGGTHPYLVANCDEVEELITGKTFAEVSSYKNCRKKDSMRKYNKAVENIKYEEYYTQDLQSLKVLDYSANILIQLIKYRNKVWEVDNWKPNWEDDYEYKYVIENCEGSLTKECYHTISKLFAFKSEKIADWFMKKFKEEFKILIENNLL